MIMREPSPDRAFSLIAGIEFGSMEFTLWLTSDYVNHSSTVLLDLRDIDPDYGGEVTLARSETCIIVEQQNRSMGKARISQAILLTKLFRCLQKLQMKSIGVEPLF